MTKDRQFETGAETLELKALLRLVNDKVDPALLEYILREGTDFLRGVGTSQPETRPEGATDVWPSDHAQERHGKNRWQDAVIDGEIPDGASILDLGCGEGHLLTRMAREKKARVQGVEIDPAQVELCLGKGVPVIQTDLDNGLRVFPDSCFDYVILEETLQTLRHPNTIISEMRRVGKRGIVSFPNFGYWKVRMDLAVRGRMPVTPWLPYRWYQTPNIHLFTLLDFIDYAREIKMDLISIHVLKNGACAPFRHGDNLYAEEALVVFE